VRLRAYGHCMWRRQLVADDACASVPNAPPQGLKWHDEVLPPLLPGRTWAERIASYVVATITGGNDYVERTVVSPASVLLAYLRWSQPIGPLAVAMPDASTGGRWTVTADREGIRRLLLVCYATRAGYKRAAVQQLLAEEQSAPQQAHDALRKRISVKLANRGNGNGNMPTYTATQLLTDRIATVTAYSAAVLHGELRFAEDRWTQEGGGFVVCVTADGQR